MNINSKQIHGLPVRTRSGTALGKVVSLDFDADTGHLVALHISSGIVKNLLSDELIIAWNQIVEITKEEVIVADTAIPAGASAIALA